MRVCLSPEAVESRVAALPGWVVLDGILTKTFEFGTYKDGLVFGSVVGFLADGMDHHPDLMIGYRKVTIGLSTHDAGGLTELDFALADKIQGLLV